MSAFTIVPSAIFTLCTALLASSEFPIAFAAISAATIVFAAIFALVTASFLIVILFHVPWISPAIWILPALEVVAYGTLADEPILIQAVPSQI